LCSTDEQRKKVYLLRYFDPETEEPESVPDPYYGGMQGFENVFQMVKRSSQFLLDELKSHIKE
jgi:protein-tyrosine phosphatase